jgi:hypothetical protein
MYTYFIALAAYAQAVDYFYIELLLQICMLLDISLTHKVSWICVWFAGRQMKFNTSKVI